MKNEETENQTELQNTGENSAEKREDFTSELDAPVWSVISFEKRVGQNLNYADARAMLDKLVGEKVSGLCIITDEAAEKMSANDFHKFSV